MGFIGFRVYRVWGGSGFMGFIGFRVYRVFGLWVYGVCRV